MQYLKMVTSSNPTTPDAPPAEVNIGAINPFALVEALVGRRLDPTSPDTARVISDVLQTEYTELFDMRYCSVLFAGLKLNEREKKAERMGKNDLRILTDEDMVTPDMSRIKKLGDLEHVGLKDILELQVQEAHIRSGKVRLALHPHMLGHTLSNSAVTEPLCETSTPFRKRKGGEGEWVPPNCSWQDMGELSQQIQRMRLVNGEFGMGMGMDANGASDMERAFAMRLGRQQMEQMMQRPKGMSSDPVQGALANSWLVAALFAVAWAEPYRIVRDHAFSFKPTDKSKKHTLVIPLYSKGGENDASTSKIEVDTEIPTNNSSGLPIYCQPASRIGTLWPSLYEKAFAKWLSKDSSSSHPDITRTSAVANGGDPVKAMAQINDGKPQYFFTKSRTAADLIGLVRANSINFKTIHPMAAFTHATGSAYNGCSIVANHAYSVLGWAPTPAGGGNQYIVLRNPWGVTEPAGLTTYPGLIQPLDTEAWSPASMIDPQGVFALDANAFKEYFACLGMAKQKNQE